MEKILKVLSMHGLNSDQAVPTNKHTIYGFAVDETNSDPTACVTYIEDAIGMTPASNPSEGNFDGGSWLDVYPFNSIRPVFMDVDGNVIGEADENDFSLDVNGVAFTENNYTMIEIPPVYWNFTKTGTGYEVRWSDKKVNNNYQALAHERGGVLKGNLYVGAYEGFRASSNSGLLSKSNQTPTTTQTLDTLRTNATTHNSEGYGIMNFHTLTLLRILFVTMFKSLNSQAVFGKGKTEASSIANTGSLANKGMYYASPTSSNVAVKFMGIENLWGNILSLIDGLLVAKGIVYISDNTIFNNDGTGYAYTFTPTTDFTSQQKYIVGVVGEQVGAFFPRVGGGSSSTYYCDTALIYQNANTYAIASGGLKSDATAAGLFRIGACSPTASGSNYGARLQYLAP